MRKTVLVALIIAANLWIIGVGYAQDAAAVTATGGSITVAGSTVSAGKSDTAASPDHVSWNSASAGTIVFPAGQSILIGGSAANVVNEIEIVETSSAATQETQVRIISGCIVVDVPAGSTNPFVVQSDNQQNSVRIYPVALVQICQDANGTLVVTRLGGDGVIQVLAGSVVIVSDVQAQASTDCFIPVLNPSGVGIGWIPCP